MGALSRRRFLTVSGLGLGALAGGGLAGCAASMKGDFAPKSGPRVVVIGGGWGGATAAKYVRLLDPGGEVILIEPGRRFVSCPFSNLVVAGVRTIDSLTIDAAVQGGAAQPGRSRGRRGQGDAEDDPGRHLRRPGRLLLEPPLAATRAIMVAPMSHPGGGTAESPE
jgi:choline dehydrogenase-like flavoprotein